MKNLDQIEEETHADVDPELAAAALLPDGVQIVPGGSAYPGPAEALERYVAVVERSSAESSVKGAKNPYTSLNGHMFSFLGADGAMALRLPEELQEPFLARYDSGQVTQFGRVMQGYVAVPDDLLLHTGELVGWFDQSHDWIGTLTPKPTRK